MSQIPSTAAPSPGLSIPLIAPRTARAAQEFEANLIASLLDSMEKTFAAVPGEEALPGADNYNYIGTHALAEIMAAHGGFGIGRMIAAQLGKARR